MKKVAFVFALWAFLPAVATELGEAFVVRQPEAAKPCEVWAAEELARYLTHRVSGKFTVEGFGGVTFHVGDTSFAKEKGYAHA